VTLICGRLLGFNSPLALWGGVAVVVGAARAAYANVLVKRGSLRHEMGIVVNGLDPQ